MTDATTAIATRNQTPAGLAQFEPQSLKEAHLLFDVLIKTRYLPKHIGTPQQAIAIWLLAKEHGIPMMTALTRMYVVHGTPAMDSALMVARVRSSGVCASWEVVESTDKRAVIRTKRKGQKHSTDVAYTIEDAQRMGLTSKDQYKKQPGVMLLHRCEAKAARQEYQDVVQGLLTKEEALDHVHQEPSGDSTAQVMAVLGAPAVEDAEYDDAQAAADPIADAIARFGADHVGAVHQALGMAAASSLGDLDLDAQAKACDVWARALSYKAGPPQAGTPDFDAYVETLTVEA